MKRADYLEKRKEIKRDYEEKLAALDKVFAMFGGTPVGVTANEAAASAAGGWHFDVSKREAVRLALKHIPVGTFVGKDVRTVLDKDYAEYSQRITDNQLSAILSNFAAKKQLALHRKKSGNSPALYEIKAPQ